MPPVTTEPVTGIQSTSGKITAVAVVAGVLAVVLPHTQANQPSAEVMATTIVGGATMLGSILAKLWHDVRVRQIGAAGGELSAAVAEVHALADPLRQALPAIQADVARLKGMVMPQTPAAPAAPPQTG